MKLYLSSYKLGNDLEMLKERQMKVLKDNKNIKDLELLQINKVSTKSFMPF